MQKQTLGIPVYPAYTWAAKPAATAAAGLVIRISDVGIAPGILVISDGTRWIPLGVQMLARFGAAQAAITGSLSEAVCWTVTVPAGLLGLSGGLRIRDKRSRTSNANAHTQRIRWGGLAGDVVLLTSVASVGAIQLDAEIRNRSSASLQILSASGAGFFPSGATTWATATRDTTAAVDLVGTVQLATSTADSVTPESLTVELLP